MNHDSGPVDASLTDLNERVVGLERRVDSLERLVRQLREAALQQRRAITRLTQRETKAETRPNGHPAQPETTETPSESGRPTSVTRTTEHSTKLLLRNKRSAATKHEPQQPPTPPATDEDASSRGHTAEAAPSTPAEQSGPWNFAAATQAERFAKICIWTIAALIPMIALVEFAVGMGSNSSAEQWLFAIFLLPVSMVSAIGFPLAIARYRRSSLAILAAILCCGLSTLLSFGFALHGAPGSAPSGYEQSKLPSSAASLGLFTFSSVFIGSLCLIGLRVGESINRHLFHRDPGSPSLVRVPKSWRLIYAVVVLWSGLVLSAVLAIGESSSLLQGIANAIFRELILVTACGAVASQLPLVLIPAIGVLVVFTLTTCVTPWRSPHIAKRCIPIYFCLSSFVMLLEPYLAPGLAVNRAWNDGGAGAAISTFGSEFAKALPVEVAKEFIPLPVRLIIFLMVGIWWVVYAIATWKAVDKDAKVAPLLDVMNATRPWKTQCLVRLKTGAISTGINFALMLLVGVGTMVFAAMFGLDWPIGVPEVLVLILLLTCLYPIPGTLVFTAMQMWRASRPRLLSWEPWERAASIWLAHTSLGLPAWITFHVLVLVVLGVTGNLR